MSINLQVVSKYRERKKGFYQAQYRDKEASVQILLHHCLAGVRLERHKHRQLQFGYNFWGKYAFGIGNDLAHIDSGSSYLIDGGIEHDAVAKSDYYSIDIKYHGTMHHDKILNMSLESDSPIELQANERTITVQKIVNGSLLRNGILLLASESLQLDLVGTHFSIEPMKLYRLESDESVTVEYLSSKEKGELLGITIE
jgi:hypothetical protein